MRCCAPPVHSLVVLLSAAAALSGWAPGPEAGYGLFIENQTDRQFDEFGAG